MALRTMKSGLLHGTTVSKSKNRSILAAVREAMPCTIIRSLIPVTSLNPTVNTPLDQAKHNSDELMQFHWRFLHPRYWPNWLLFAVIWLLSHLPRPVAIRVGNGLGWAHRRFNHKRRAIVDTNLRRCFPEWSAAELEQATTQHYRYFGRSYIDLGLLWWSSERRLRRLIQFKGKTAYLELLEKDNVILILPHFHGLDLGGSYCAILHPSICMMKQQSNALLNWQLWKGRSRFPETRIIMREQGLRPLIKALRQRIACFYLPDEDFGGGSNTIFTPFFGIETATLTSLSGMARLGKAKVIPVLPRMLPDGGYEVEFGPVLAGFPSGDERADAAQMNAVIEAAIRQSPAQYMWTFKWFQTRPVGEAAFYP